MGTSNCSTCSLEYISLVSGIQSIKKEPDFNIFPNPARNEITVSVRHFIQPMTIEFFDNLGRAIKTEKIYTEKSTLTISELSPAVPDMLFNLK